MGLRDKFQGAKLSANKVAQKSAAENNKNFSDGKSRVDFLSVDEGKNVFRILPPHPDDTVGAAYIPKRVAMLQCEIDKYKDGERTGETEVKNKNIFVATQHGGLPKDPIELYIDYVRKYAEDAFDSKEDRQKFLTPITGWRDKDGWHWGVAPKTSFVCYAVKDGKVGRLELYESWVKDMNKLAITEQADDVIDVDPFSDPNEGFPLVITKQKAVDKNGKQTDKWEYLVAKDEPSHVKRESWDKFFERTRVTDEQLEELLTQEPLSKLYGSDVYSKRDWDLAIDGLRRFDEKEKYGIFENDEFVSELQELESLVPEKEETNSDENTEKTFEKAKEESESGEISILEMKNELKRFVKKEFGEEYVDQIPFSKQKVQQWYALLEEGETLPIELKKEQLKKEGKVVSKTVEEDSPVEESDTVEDEDLKKQIEKLRNKVRK